MTTNLIPMHTALAPSVGSLDAYMHYANTIPLLSAEEETEYAKAFTAGDLSGARKLVLAHLRYVIRIARGYIGYGLPLADLIQEGNIGLMKAVKRFDPNVGVRLVSFAVHWIKAEIHEYILKNWRIVKIATTKAQRKLFFNLRQMKQRLGWFSKQEVQFVAKDLGVTEKEVLHMEERLNAMDVAFDMTDADDDSDTPHIPAHYLHDPKADPAYMLEHTRTTENEHEQLFQALETLDERSRDILTKRWLSEDKATLADLAAAYGISQERVRQLEQNAMMRIKKHICS